MRILVIFVVLALAACVHSHGVKIESLRSQIQTSAGADAEAEVDLSTLSDLGYKVMTDAAHETANCRALQNALFQSNIPADLKNTAFYQHFSSRFHPDLLKCDSMTKVGAVGASVQGMYKEFLKAAGTAVDKVHSFFAGVGQKIAAAATGFKNRLLNFFKGKGSGSSSAHSHSSSAGSSLQPQQTPQIPPETTQDVEKSLDDVWPALVIGSREPDLPCTGRDDQVRNCLAAVAVGGAKAAIEGKVLDLKNTNPAEVDMKTKKVELAGFSVYARDSHFGYMSIGHSQTADIDTMGVLGVVQALKNPTKIEHYKFSRRRGAQAIPNPTQKDVQEMVIDWDLHLFKLASEALNKPSGAWKFFIYHMARLGHNIMDSFSCAHTIRSADASKHYPILHYQDYGFQSGDLHGKNGDELVGSSPFKGGQTAGYNYGTQQVSKAFQIFIHQAISVVEKKPYVPVDPHFQFNAAEKMDHGSQELRAHLEQVYKLYNQDFEKFPAGGCVTKDTVAPGKEAGICKLEKAKQMGLPAGSKICPDRPATIETLFAAGGGSSHSSGSRSAPARAPTKAGASPHGKKK